MTTLKGKSRDERSKLLSASVDSSQLDAYTEYTYETTKLSNCNFVKQNKKPLIAIVILLFLGLSATLTMLYLDHEGFWDKPNPIDKIWWQQTLTNTTTPQGLYPLWLKSSTINNNISLNSLYLYKTQYGQYWNIDETQNYNYSTLITQSQLIYNFATAYGITRNITYYIAMLNGINTILNKFNDTQNGGYYYSINETQNGNNINYNYNKNSIGHSMFMYAISNAFIVTPNNEIPQKELYLNILNNTYDIFQKYFFDEFGGIYDNLAMNWNEIDENNTKSQLSLMYYFEALSQLLRVAQNIGSQYRKVLRLDVIKNDIQSMFNFTCDLLYEYRDDNNRNYYVLYERYDTNWSSPLTEEISLGNAYKWSYLISYFIDENIIEINDRNYATLFLQYAIDLGYDKELQKIHDEILNANTKDINPPYWTVCNAIKILYYYWYDYGQQNNDDWLDILKNVIIYYQDFYYDDFIGGIYYSKPDQVWKGNISKVDYQCIDTTLYVTQSVF